MYVSLKGEVNGYVAKLSGKYEEICQFVAQWEVVTT